MPFSGRNIKIKEKNGWEGFLCVGSSSGDQLSYRARAAPSHVYVFTVFGMSVEFYPTQLICLGNGNNTECL